MTSNILLGAPAFEGLVAKNDDSVTEADGANCMILIVPIFFPSKSQ